MFARIGAAAESVLGREDSRHGDPLVAKHIDQMAVADHSRMVGQHGDATVSQRRQVFVRALGAYLDAAAVGFGGRYALRRRQQYRKE